MWRGVVPAVVGDDSGRLGPGGLRFGAELAAEVAAGDGGDGDDGDGDDGHDDDDDPGPHRPLAKAPAGLGLGGGVRIGHC